MMNFSHQDRIFDPAAAQSLTIIGVGSIGSMVALTAAKMGVSRITVYDGDSVESHNIPMSAYRPQDLGHYKVNALQEIVRENSGTEIVAIPDMYNGERLKNTVIACVDTMEARQQIFQAVRKNPLVDLFIDTRVGGEFISIFAIEPAKHEDIEFYEQSTQYKDLESIVRSCGTHGFYPISVHVASAACLNLTNFWFHGKKKRLYRELCVALERIS